MVQASRQYTTEAKEEDLRRIPSGLGLPNANFSESGNLEIVETRQFDTIRIPGPTVPIPGARQARSPIRFFSSPAGTYCKFKDGIDTSMWTPGYFSPPWIVAIRGIRVYAATSPRFLRTLATCSLTFSIGCKRYLCDSLVDLLRSGNPEACPYPYSEFHPRKGFCWLIPQGMRFEVAITAPLETVWPKTELTVVLDTVEARPVA